MLREIGSDGIRNKLEIVVGVIEQNWEIRKWREEWRICGINPGTKWDNWDSAEKVGVIE